MRLTTPRLIEAIYRAGRSGALLRDGSLRYSLFLGPTSMVPLVRAADELFSSFVQSSARDLTMAVNGNYYDITTAGKADAYFGHDPVGAAETLIEGQVVSGGRVVGGASRPIMFYFAQMAGNRPNTNVGPGWYFKAGRGNPPTGTGTIAAIGGLGPLIITSLPFGAGNLYRPGHQGPATGEPGPAQSRYLVQRNNETFRSADSRPASTGKPILAYSAQSDALLVGVQQHGLGPRQSYRYIAQALAGNGFSDAIFLDGSDSAMMWFGGRFEVMPGDDKDETITVGLGFRHRPPPPPPRRGAPERDPFARPRR